MSFRSLFVLGAGGAALGVAALGLFWVLRPEPEPIFQDLLGDEIGFSGAVLNLRTYADPDTGDKRIISMTAQPENTGNQDLFVTTQNGVVTALSKKGDTVEATKWFDYNASVKQARKKARNGYLLDQTNEQHGGLRAVAFHPEFAENGKFYTAALVRRPKNVSGLTYVGRRLDKPAAESLVAEWTFDREIGQVDPQSYRELFRVQMPVFDHPIKQIKFNPFAKPGDEDYGLLYVAHGDGSTQSTDAGDGLDPGDALGKVLRINPLQDGINSYTTPGNPFLIYPATLNEIYTLGHRNPHHFAFATSGDRTHIIVADTGRDNIEEIDVLQPGGNYGWGDREGTFVHNRETGPKGMGYGLDYGVSALPDDEWAQNDYIYPAAQYDHSTGLGGILIGSVMAGGYVIQNNSDPALQDQYIFADFGIHTGEVYQVGLAELLAAKTYLEDGEPPSALTQAPLSRLKLTLDEDGDGKPDVQAETLTDLLGVERTDVRFGRGPKGEMFISCKTTGLVYLVTNTVPNSE